VVRVVTTEPVGDNALTVDYKTADGQLPGEMLNDDEANARNISEDIWESDDALSPENYENFEETVIDQAASGQTIQEREAEIIILERLEEQACMAKRNLLKTQDVTFLDLIGNGKNCHVLKFKNAKFE